LPWLRIDDTAPDDPKVLRAGAHAFGFAALCAAWSAGKVGKIPDAWVPEYIAQRTDPDWDALAKRCVKAGIFSRPQRIGGERGWFVDQTDQLLHMRTNDEVQADREKSRATRQTGATRDVRLRDGDQCRYCGKSVNWADRVSARGGSYDHPDPADRDVFVVACLGCNRAKAGRTPAEAAMPLLPVPDEPLIGAQTAQRFSVPQTAPARASKAQTPPARTPQVQTPPEAARAPQADAAASPGHERSDTARPEGPGPICDPSGEVVQTYPRRDGTGPGQVGTGGQPVRAGPRRTPRGSRAGRRGKPPTQPDRKD
jgi:hypothetical protein